MSRSFSVPVAIPMLPVSKYWSRHCLQMFELNNVIIALLNEPTAAKNLQIPKPNL